MELSEIKRLYLHCELLPFPVHGVKFRDEGEKPASEVVLGKSKEAAEVAFYAATIASEKTLQLIKEKKIFAPF